MPDTPGATDPCGTGEDDPPFTPPSTSELLQLRVAELNDRMRLLLSSPHASSALRRGWQAAQTPSHAEEALRLLASAPDRIDDGFDTYVAVLLVMAANSLGTGDAQHAARFAQQAAVAAPDDPLPLVLGAVAEQGRSDAYAARTLLARAFALDPEEPAIARALAWQLADGADVSAALVAFDAYLAAYPDDRAAARRRARLAVRRELFAGALTYVRGELRLVASPSFPQERAAHVLDVVDTSLVRYAQTLGVARREELAIFVHADRPTMQRAACVQAWAGAVYDGALELDAETVADDAGDPSIRHECFHASVHPAVPHVPTWLDEGLAEYLSGEDRPSRLASYELMVREHTWIPFATMNDAFLVIDDGTDAGLAYDQALAMVEWLVDRRGPRGIRDAAHYLIDGGDPTGVLAAAAHQELDGDALLSFVGRRVAELHAGGHAPPP